MKRYIFLIQIMVCIALMFSSCANPAEDGTDTINYTPDEYVEGSSEYLGYEAAMELALSYQDIIMSADRGISLNIVVSHEVVEKIVSQIGGCGYPVIDAENSISMCNPEAVSLFCEEAAAGKDSEVTLYLVYTDGGLAQYEFRCEEGDLTLNTVHVDWTGLLEPEVTVTGSYRLESLSLTEKGWMIYKMDLSDYTFSKPFNVNPYKMIKLSPQDYTAQMLCKKYLLPVGYEKNDMFLISWDSDSVNTVDFGFLFQFLYMTYSDEMITYIDNPFSIDENAGWPLFRVSADIFENVVCTYFGITPQELRNLQIYDAEAHEYVIHITQPCAYSTVPKIPVPEIVNYWYNEDGSLTMRVEALFCEFGTDCAFTHEVTVMENVDGSFHYISNAFYESEDNILHDIQFRIGNEISRYYGS